MGKIKGMLEKRGKKIVAVYCPLIDLVPSDADTILKTMVEAELRAKATG